MQFCVHLGCGELVEGGRCSTYTLDATRARRQSRPSSGEADRPHTRPNHLIDAEIETQDALTDRAAACRRVVDAVRTKSLLCRLYTAARLDEESRTR